MAYRFGWLSRSSGSVWPAAVDDAADVEKTRRHVDELTAMHRSGGPYELRAVTLEEFRRLLLQAAAQLLLHGQREDALECLPFDPN
jgi:hypothetical protein